MIYGKNISGKCEFFGNSENRLNIGEKKYKVTFSGLFGGGFTASFNRVEHGIESDAGRKCYGLLFLNADTDTLSYMGTLKAESPNHATFNIFNAEGHLETLYCIKEEYFSALSEVMGQKKAVGYLKGCWELGEYHSEIEP